VVVRDALLPDFDHEMAVTRRVLARVPDASLGWRPHEKSFDMGGLAWHLAQIPRWGQRILNRDSFDLAESAGVPHASAPSRAAALDAFDRHVAEVRRALVDQSDAELLAPWSLLRDGHLLMSLPRIAAFRSLLIHHSIHHRGQMTVYLRLQGVPVPPIYGATADQQA
jgi:uncharacterized damage-inducible protein DinB